MKKPAILLLILGSVFSGSVFKESPSPYAKDALQILDGVFVGMGSRLRIEDISTCLTDLNKIIQDFKLAEHSLKKETWDDVKLGLQYLSNALDQMPTAIRMCESAEEKTAKIIETAIDMIKNPWSLVVHAGKSILVNGKEIYQDISAAHAAWNSAQWYNFGYEIGEVITIVILEINIEHPNQDVMTKFILGIIEGLNSDIHMTEIEDCLTNFDESRNWLTLGYANLKTRDFDAVRLGLKEIALAVKDLPLSIANCKAESLYFAGVIKYASDAMVNPIAYAFEDGKMMAINGKRIMAEMDESLQRWENKEWEEAGISFGKAIGNIFNEPENDLN